MAHYSEEKKELLKRTIQEKVAALVAMVGDPRVVSNGQQLLDCEKSIAALTDAIAGHVVEAVVARSADDKTLVARAKRLVKQSPVRMKRRDERGVTIADRKFDFSGARRAYEETLFTSAQIRASRSRPPSLPSSPH